MKCFLVLILLFLLQTGVDSSHFRGGFISWKVVAPLTVQFTIYHSWRADAPDYIGFQFGDGSASTFGYDHKTFSGLDSEGEAYNTYLVQTNHTYSRAGQYYAYWTSCCRIYTVLNSESSNFQVRTIVDLASTWDSPTSTLPALIQMTISSTSTYNIGVADPHGFTCSLTNQADSQITSTASINGQPVTISPSCQIIWDTSAGNVGDKYAVSVSVAQIGSQTVIPLDFIVELVPASYLPTFEVVPYNPVVVLGQAFEVTITGTSGRPNVNQLTLSVLGLAGDATVNPPPYTTGDIPFRVFFSSAAQIPGSFSTVIVFSDPNNFQSTYTIAYSVIKPSECSEVSFTSCSTLGGLTYYNFNSNPAATYQLSNNCSGSYLSQNGSFSFTSTEAQGPAAKCAFSMHISETIAGSTQVANCTLTTTCPTCNSVTQSGTVKTICRNDSAPVYTVLPAQSVDKYLNGDTLATVVDSDGNIVSTAYSTLPPGVGIYANGGFYVASRPDLIEGTYTVTVTNTDVFGGVYTQTVTIVLLNVVCGSGLSACGAACYDPNVLTCVTGNNQRLLCPVNQVYCPNSTNTCYNPSTQVCNAGTLCQIGSAICGSGCYQPSQLSCNLGTNGAYTLCPTNLGFCGTGCYDPSSNDCINNVVVSKSVQFCNGVPYNPASYDCVGTNILCPKGYLLCGNACFLNTVYTCQPNFQLCPVAEELCGTTCYDETIYVCVDASTSTIAPINP